MAVTYRNLQRIAAQNAYDLADPKQAELALRDAVNFETLAKEALARGYDQDPEIRHYVRTQAVQKLLLETVDSKETAPAPPTEDELRAYFESHKKEFTPPTLARGQILALLKRKGQETEFAQKLEAVKNAIAAKELPFGELVNRLSDDPAAKQYAGVTNWIVSGEENKLYPPAVLEAVFAAKDTTAIAGPIEHNDWVYFVKLHERRDGAATAYEQAKGRIAQQMQRSKRLDSYNRFVETLGKATKVETFPDKVREAATAGQKPSDGPPMGPVSLPKK
ncbi:MAG: peptidyl-prolyl cis-trans isomerase [Verrucomicrobia bacterium]|nr:peptidyl-prolyl cis-trans isomerase [Verrucomicrobiota bacterium]